MDPIKVLYVEDEIQLAKIVSESLVASKFDVTTLHSGVDVLSHFAKLQPDICVLDIMLPVKDGFMIADEIRKINRVVPIIFLTAKGQMEDILKGFNHGGNDYLKKPFSLAELIARINNLIAITSKKNKVEDIITFGEYTFSCNKQQLYFQSNIMKLSFRETQLLYMFYMQQHGIIPRKDVLLSIWGDDSYFNSRSLDVYISKLRQYLSNDKSITILTIKGVGFRFVTT